jgi:hypothetical protein
LRGFNILVGIGFISLIIVNFIVGIVRIFKPEFCEPPRVIELKEEVDNRARLAIDYLMAERIKSRREVGLRIPGNSAEPPLQWRQVLGYQFDVLAPLRQRNGVAPSRARAVSTGGYPLDSSRGNPVPRGVALSAPFLLHRSDQSELSNIEQFIY